MDNFMYFSLGTAVGSLVVVYVYTVFLVGLV